MGWEPAEVTTYEHDGALLVRSVTVREPEWADGELAGMLDHLAEDRQPRGSHGHLLSEAMSPDADPSSHDSKYKYVVPGPSRDYAATALAAAQDAYQKKFPESDLSALKWRVEKRPR